MKTNSGREQTRGGQDGVKRSRRRPKGVKEGRGKSGGGKRKWGGSVKDSIRFPS